MSQQDEQLPEGIRELFQQGLNVSGMDFQDLGCTPEEYQEKIQQALPKLLGQHKDTIAKAREIYEREDYHGIAIPIFQKMERMAMKIQGMASGANQDATSPPQNGISLDKRMNLRQAIAMGQGMGQGQQSHQDQHEDDDDEELCSDEHFGILLSQAVDTAEAGRLEDAMAMYSLLQIIRPDQPQPYINNFTLVWQQSGVKVAADCYAMMMPIVQSPTFCYYAADCFEHADRMEEAQQAITMAVELLDNKEYGFQLEPKLEQDIRQYHRELLHLA